MNIFNIFIITEPFKTGASASGLGVPYTIQYNMSVMGTELDGTRYLRNYGKGGNPFNAEAFASNHIFLNGTTQSVPYPVLHDLGSDIATGVISSTAGALTITPITNGYNVVCSGAGASSIGIEWATTIDSIGDVLKLDMTALINSGSFDVNAIQGVIVPAISLVNGTNSFEGESLTSALKFDLSIAGDVACNVDITFSSVKEITLPTASYLSIMQADGTIKQFSADGDSGSTLAVSTIHSEIASHQFVFNSTSPLTTGVDGDVAEIEADPNLAFRMFFDGEILPSGFSNTDVDWFSGGNEGLASAEKVYDLSDQTFLTYASIVGYDAATRTTLANQSKGATNLKLIQDGSGRTTATVIDNTTQWKQGANAPTGWTVTAPYTITEIIGADTYTFTSDLNRYKNDIADGTFTAPIGVWTLGEFAFDGVTPTPSRGNTKMIDAVVVP